MDSSPDPTVVLTNLKKLDTFIGNNKTSSFNRGATEPRRLNFSANGGGSSTLSFQSLSSPEVARGLKRNNDALVGFDVAKKLREKESEIINNQATVTRLQGRLHEMELSNKKAKVEADAKIRTYQYKQQRDKELIADLHHKIKKIQEEKEEARENLKTFRAQLDSANLETMTRDSNVQEAYIQLNTKMQEKIQSLQEEISTLEKDLAEKTSKVTLAESYTEVVEGRLTDLQEKLKKAAEYQSQAQEQKLQLDQALSRVKELEFQLDDMQESKKQQKVLEAAMCKVPILESELQKIKDENKFLRDTARNIQLLEEQLTTAQQQVKHLEKRCEDKANLQANLDLHKESLDKFESIIGKELGLGPRGTLEDLKEHLNQMKQEDKVVTDSLAQLRASHKSLKEGRLQEIETINMLKDKLKKQEAMIQHQAGQAKRLNRRIFLVTKERDSLKAILSSYESEATINYSVVGQDRIDRLENQLMLYKKEVDKLTAELQEASNAASNVSIDANMSSQERKEDLKKIVCLEEKILMLEKELEKVNQQKEVLELRLEHRTLKGDYDPTATKVLHFKDNPHARAVEKRKTEIENLQKDNKALQERVKLLEQGETKDLTLRVGVKVTSESHKEVIELQEKVSSQERQNKRLMEAFQRKARDMREIVYRLTGYRVDSVGEKQYKLIHMYAESPDDFLLFEHTPAREIQLLETEFSSTIDDLIDAYLRHENSYPAFLAAITLDLFNRQTKYQEHSSTGEEEEDMDDEGKCKKGNNGRRDQEAHDDDDDLVILD